MAKDRRYTTIKYLIVDGHIKSFRDIFNDLPKSVVARDLGINNVRFSKLINNVELFVLKELYRFAEFIEIEHKILLDLVDQQYTESKKKK
jgi:hypothetical protein